MDPALLKIQDIWDRHVPAPLLKIGNQRGPFQKILKKKIIWLGGKESTCNEGDTGSILRSGRSPGEGHDNPLQYSCLENPWTEEPGRLHGVAKNRTWLKLLSSNYKTRLPPGRQALVYILLLFWPHQAVCGILSSLTGYWTHTSYSEISRVVTTGPPGKSLKLMLNPPCLASVSTSFHFCLCSRADHTHPGCHASPTPLHFLRCALRIHPLSRDGKIFPPRNLSGNICQFSLYELKEIDIKLPNSNSTSQLAL